MKSAKEYSTEIFQQWRQARPHQYMEDCMAVALDAYANAKLEEALIVIHAVAPDEMAILKGVRSLKAPSHPLEIKP